MIRKLGFYKKLLSAWKGMHFYKKLIKQQKINTNTFILIQKSDDDELIDYGNKYLPAFIKNNYTKQLVILSSDEYKKKLGSTLPDIKKVNYPVKKLDNLISLYCMWRFTKNILIFSVNKPSTNRLLKLMESGVLNKEEAVAIGIYGLNSIEV